MKRLLSIVIVILLSIPAVFANDNNGIHFRYLNTENDLSHTSVLSLYEDECGFIWIGTKEGLNRYNGTRVDHCNFNKDSNGYLLSNNIKRVIGDKKGNIFILSIDGLARYNTDADRFDTLWYDSDLATIHYSEDLYVSRRNMVYLFDTKSEQFISKLTLPDQVKITALLKVDNIIYIGTTNGLYTYNTLDNSINKLIHEKCEISYLYLDSNKCIWVSTWDRGLLCINDSKIIEHFTYTKETNNSISANFVRECCEDNFGNLWIGTFSGLDKYDKKTKSFTHFKPSSKNGSLSHSSVWSIIKDNQGTIWLSTYFGGINYFNPEHTAHKEYVQSKTEQEGLSSPIVSRMTEDNDNNLWICTEGAGVNVLNRNTDKFKWYLPINGKNSISNANVKAVYFDKKRNFMWFGSHLGGLSKLNLKTQQFKHFTHDEKHIHSIPSNIIRDIVPYKDNLIIATDRGVALFDINTEQFEQIKSDKYSEKITDVYAILVDKNNNLWISVVGDGLFKYSLEDRIFIARYSNTSENNKLSNNNINSMYEDSANNIYLCTSGSGIDVVTSNNELINLSVNDGLISNSVYNIIEVTKDNFIITTNLGVSVYNSKKNSFTNFTSFNGFSLTSINDNALYVTKDKNIYIGGLNGLISLKLSDLNFPQKPFDIYLDRLFINNKEVRPNDKTGILKTSLLNTNKIVLPHNYSAIEVDVTTNNYFTYNKTQLEYKLEGFSKRWIPLSTSSMRITYTNLNPGKYKLIVRAKSNTYSQTPQATLRITILPPWYLTPWAYMAYIITSLLIILYFLNAYRKRVDLVTSLKYEKEHNKNIEKLNQSKLNFFTNISHEFRTPLTVIISQLDYLLKHDKFTTDVYNKMLNIYKNSLQLNELTNELLDFKKQEAGKTKLRVAQHDVIQFLNENFIMFKEFANTKQVNFIYEPAIKQLNLWYDTAQLQKVMNNLLSNAFKYTEKGDNIKIVVYRNENQCIIQISDTGEGINELSIQHIFERFYQVDDSNLLNGGSGIGLALTKGIIELHHGTINVQSEPNQGTTFTISLPLGKDHFSNTEIIDNAEEDKFSNEALVKELDLFKAKQETADNNTLQKDTKILIVEDNEDLRRTLVEIFSFYYNVIEAADGAIALKIVESQKPDIILSDIVMPNMTGIELCKAVKSNINTCHIPVVLLTAKTSLEHNLEGLRIGADDYISKPFNVEILVSRCNNLINSRRLLHEVFSKQPQVTAQKLATNPIDKELIDKATEIIEENIDNTQFNMNDFAQEMGMSRTNLFNKIKSLTGQTPNNFISTMRLKRAAYLLKNNPELNISDIASITGFSTSHYFSKCFKDTYQQTPTEYRES